MQAPRVILGQLQLRATAWALHLAVRRYDRGNRAFPQGTVATRNTPISAAVESI